MKPLLIAAAAPLALGAGPAFAQDPHAHHQHGPAAAPIPPAADPHAGHAMPARPADPHAGHGAHGASPPAPSAGQGGHVMGVLPAGYDPPPEPPADHAADRLFAPADMARARAQLRREHGDVRWSKVMLETAEIRLSGDGDAWAWEGEASFGGDLNRLVLKSEGEGASGELESAEVQALYGRALGPYFNLQVGVRHDVEPGPQRTYAVLGVEGVAPYWFEVEAALFLSDRGDLSARLEGSYDLRLTQRLILEPRAEANLAAGADRARGLGSGLQDVELGLRLRYAIRGEIAPYVGVHHERKLGDTADLARRRGQGTKDTRVAFGLRAWF